MTKHGYGVSYIFTIDQICLHVASFKDSPHTVSLLYLITIFMEWDEIVILVSHREMLETLTLVSVFE